MRSDFDGREQFTHLIARDFKRGRPRSNPSIISANFVDMFPRVEKAAIRAEIEEAWNDRERVGWGMGVGPTDVPAWGASWKACTRFKEVV